MSDPTQNSFEVLNNETRRRRIVPLALLGALLLIGARVVQVFLGTLHVTAVDHVESDPELAALAAELYQSAAWLEGPTAAAFVLGAVLLAAVDPDVPLVGAMAAAAGLGVLTWAVGGVPPDVVSTDALATFWILVAHWAWFGHRGLLWGARLCAAGGIGLAVPMVGAIGGLPVTVTEALLTYMSPILYGTVVAAWIGGWAVLLIRVWAAVGGRVGRPAGAARAEG